MVTAPSVCEGPRSGGEAATQILALILVVDRP